jgi:sec-independent protein translocase protein TatB
MTPKAALTKHLLDGDDSWLTGEFETPPVKAQSATMPSAHAASPPSGPAPFDADAT